MQIKSIIVSIFLCFPLLLSAQQPSQKDSVSVFSKLNYYSIEKAATIVCMLPNAQAEQKVDLLVYDNRNKKVSQNMHQIDDRIEVNVPLTDTGIYYYTYVVKQAGNLINRGTVTITKLLPKLNEVKINNLTGGLIVDGKSFIPFGFYCGPVGNLPDQEVVHGFNMIGPYQSNLPEGLPERKAYMNRCAAIGIKVQYGVNSLVGFGHNGDKGLDKTEAEKLELLRKEVLAFKDHPALLSWYINDEPDGQGRPPEVLEKAYRLIHELDPYHPISIVFMMPQKINQFKNTIDIAMTDPYPIPSSVNKVADDVSYLKNTLNHQRAVWLVPQAFGAQEMWPREPTAKEIRVMTYLGLLNGATGIQYYVHAPSNRNPQSVSAWSACSDMAVETAQMTPFLLSEEKAPAIQVDKQQLTAKSYWYKNHLLLVVANKENVPVQFSLGFAPAKIKLQNTASLWFENRELPITHNQISDYIDAYSTRVYLIKPEADNNLFAIPGNLTYNPDFEKVASPGLASGANANVHSNQNIDPAATFFADTRQSLHGLFSLRLTTPQAGKGMTLQLLPFVLSANNSYTVSVWAKAKPATMQPKFNLAIKELNINKSFTLDTTWRPYSFTFQATAASTNTLLTINLEDQGTAWFDMLQVNPDPVINYTINSDNTADASIVTYTKGGVIKYKLSAQPITQLTAYKHPIEISSPQTITAQLFVDNVKTGETNKYIPVNKALRKSVKYITPPSPVYPAAGPSSLTDGIMASTTFKNPNWMGFTGNEVVLQIDMQKTETLNNVTINFLCDPNSGIFLPKQIEVTLSDDGKTFSPAAFLENKSGSVRGEPYLSPLQIALQGKRARYIRMKATSVGKIPATGYLFPGTNPWIFIDELLVE